MSAVCEICGKKPIFGNTVARSGRRALKRYVRRRTRRMFKPNVQRVHVKVNGTSKHMNICTACIKSGKHRHGHDR